MSVRRRNPHIREDDVIVLNRLLKPRKRLGIGEADKKKRQNEAEQAKVLEGTSNSIGLFTLHHVDFVHFETVKDSRGTLKAGFPDYFILGDGWSAYLEIKARNPETRRPGSLSEAQRVFHAKLRAAGHEVWNALLPDDLNRVNLLLREKTGIVVEVQL